MTDPIRELEHTHDHLTKLAIAIGRALHDSKPRSRTEGKKLLALLETLRDELLHHFADEEEGLFPFVRKVLPSKAAVVDKLEASHDTICGTLVRLAHLAGDESDRPLAALYDRFEHAYAEHSRDELELFAELGKKLGERERSELSALLRGISQTLH